MDHQKWYIENEHMFPNLNGFVPNGYKPFLGPMLTYDIQHKYVVLGLDGLMQLIKMHYSRLA